MIHYITNQNMTTTAYNQESQMMRVTGANILNVEISLMRC